MAPAVLVRKQFIICNSIANLVQGGCRASFHLCSLGLVGWQWVPFLPLYPVAGSAWDHEPFPKHLFETASDMNVMVETGSTSAGADVFAVLDPVPSS